MAITLDGTNGITTPDVDTDGLTVDTNTLFVDAANNRVGIGTSSPLTILDVKNAANEHVVVSGNPVYGNNAIVGINDTGSEVGLGIAGNPLEFYTAATERARIDASGNLLVGTTSATGTKRLVVSNPTADYTGFFDSTSASDPYGPLISYTAAAPNGALNWFLSCGDTSVTRLQIRSNGGIANFSGNNVNLSDERVKTDITPLGSYWDKIKAVEVVTFKYKDQTHDDDNIGVIAQQVEAVAPEFVSNDGFGETPDDGVPLKTIYEADLHYATLKALQEAMARIEALEARVAALETNA
jgi:hypothetical protein